MDKKKRLLDTITPVWYDLTLTPDFTTFTFTGKEILTCKLIKPRVTISLHAVDLVVKEAYALDAQKIKQQATISYNPAEKSLTLSFPKKLKKGEITIEIAFSGKVSNKLNGWYKSAYTVGGKTKYFITSHFEEIGARQAFPCIDDPSAKAVFHMSVVIPKGLTAIANMTVESTKEERSLQTITFAPTPKMATYALALIIGEFEVREKKASNRITVRVFTTPGKIHQAQFALDTAAAMLPFYEEYFGIAYPLPKLDFIAIPDFDAGAMENWGAVTAREAAILIDEGKSSAVTKQWVATVLAHEISHMWFGDLVTLEWWTYLWLNEGFASYMEYMAVDKLFPQWKVWEQFAVLDHNRALGLDSLASTHPVETKVTNLDRLTENFDEISYSKGASVIYMLAEFLGNTSFKKGIHAYLKKFSYGNATTEDLWESLEKASSKPVTKIMAEFVTKPGHPLIKVDFQKNTLQVTQERFFSSLKEKTASNDKTIWNIPISISSSASIKQNFIIEKKSQVLLPVKQNQWIKLNTNESSYVRSIYSSNLYVLLKTPIQERLLSTIDRMGIVRDAFDSAQAGILSTDFALRLATSFRQEDSYIVWASLTGKLAKIANIISETSLEEDFNHFATNLLQPIGKKLGWAKKQSDSHADILLRSIVLYSLGSYKDKQTIQQAQHLFWDYINNGRPIDNDIRGVVFRLVAENGGEKEFETFKKLYSNEPFHEEKNRIGNALCSFSDTKLMQDALEFSLSSYVRLQDIGRFIMLGFDNKKGRETTWEFVKKNWVKLFELHKGQLGMSWLIEGAGNFMSREKAEDIKQFFTTHKAIELTRTIQQVLEHIDANVAWLARDKKVIREFLASSRNLEQKKI